LDGARAYLSDGGGNVRVVDVSDPHQPMDLGSISGTSATRMLTFANGVAYLSRSLGIELWDLSDLSHPRSLGSIRLPGVVQDIAVVDHWAFAANEDAGFRVVDLSNPVWPRVAGQFDLDPMAQISPYGRGFELAGGLAYVADGQELRLIDLSASGGLREISRVDSYSLDDVALVGSYAYASGFEFQVADFSDPVLPHAMPPVGFQCDAAFCGELVQIEVVGSTGYILTLSGFLLTVDVSDPSDPRLIRAYKTERTTATSMRLLGGKAYIAEYNPSLAQPLSPILEVLDVSDPADPVLVGSAPLLVPVAGLDVHDPLAYVTEPSLFINGGGLPIGDLAVYDIGDLQAAKRLGSVPFPAAGRGLEVVDGIAYAPPWAIDVSDPSRPRVLGGAGPPAFAVEVASGRVYETSDAFRVLDFGPEYAAAPEPDARSAYGIALWGLCMLRWRAAIGCRAVRGKSARH
jgi:hypothetical protein